MPRYVCPECGLPAYQGWLQEDGTVLVGSSRDPNYHCSSNDLEAFNCNWKGKRSQCRDTLLKR